MLGIAVLDEGFVGVEGPSELQFSRLSLFHHLRVELLYLFIDKKQGGSSSLLYATLAFPIPSQLSRMFVFVCLCQENYSRL